MKIGVTSMVFFARPLEESIRAIARCGFDYVEIWLEHFWRHDEMPDAGRIRDVLDEVGIEATVHCPVMDVNTTSANPIIREVSIAQMVEAARFAQGINARLMVLHPGRLTSAKEAPELHWKRQFETVCRVVKEAKSLGVQIGLENMEIDNPRHTVRDHVHLKRIMEECHLPDLGITLDTAHMRDTDKVIEFIDAMGSVIIHTHISDSTADQLHLLLGQGNLDFPRIFEALESVGYEGVLSLETFIPGDEEILKAQRETLLSYS
jgi:D-psicose/D-tagatose/L-ribulose 3-epimerase